MRLYTKNSIVQMALESWKKDAVEKFEAKIVNKDKPFPCIPATQGQQLNHFRYGFVSDPRESPSSEELALLLVDYSKCYREIGMYTSLIIFFESSLELSKSSNVEQYEILFWEQLNRINKLDFMEWPSHIPPNPEDPLWEFCFHGEQYFMYCATPSHQNRMSRHFPYFMLAITPRWVLDNFNSSKSRAVKTKAKIRKRLVDYDSIPIHPDLNSYGQKENFEWNQYFLHDDETMISKCPFHEFLNKLTENHE